MILGLLGEIFWAHPDENIFGPCKTHFGVLRGLCLVLNGPYWAHLPLEVKNLHHESSQEPPVSTLTPWMTLRLHSGEPRSSTTFQEVRDLICSILQPCATLYNLIKCCMTLSKAVQHCTWLYNLVKPHKTCTSLYNLANHHTTLYNIAYCFTTL